MKEQPGRAPTSQKMIADLLRDHETIIRQLREDSQMTSEQYHDIGTSDLLISLLEHHEKMAWMLRAMLEG